MRRLLLCLALLLSILLLSVSVSAVVPTREDLEVVYESLTLHLPEKFFKTSSAYDSYYAQIQDLGRKLEEDDLTQNQIESLYLSIRSAYVDLMQDTFDYSVLIEESSFYKNLDASLFSEETWQEFSKAALAVQGEVSSPSLFAWKKNSTEESYRKNTENYIQSLSDAFIRSYNNLQLLDLPEKITAQQLSSLITIFETSAHPVLMSNAPFWNDYQTKVANAKALTSLRFPQQARLQKAAEELLSAYRACSGEAFDMTAAQEVITQYHSLSPHNYTTDSWNRYANEISKLESTLDKCHILYLPSSFSSATCKELISDYFADISNPSKTQFKNLILLDRLRALKDLCNQYRNFQSIEGTEPKLNTLLESVNAGDLISSKKDATPEEVENAIKEIQAAAKNLMLGEVFLRQEQTGPSHEDLKTARLIVVFTLLSVLLSVLFASILSYRYFGRLNWKR